MSKKSKKAQKRKAVRRNKIIAVIVAVIAVVAVIGVIAYLAVIKTREQDAGEDFTREKELASVAADADQAIGQGNFDEGIRTYDDAINATEDNAERAQLMADKATAYFNNEQYDEALAAALEADRVDSTSSINYLIAQIYEIKQDNAKAAEYYRHAAEKIDMSNPMAEQDKAFYEARATELGGTQ